MKELTNRELQDAIEKAFERLFRSSASSPCAKETTEHYVFLLKIQAARAAWLDNTKTTKTVLE